MAAAMNPVICEIVNNKSTNKALPIIAIYVQYSKIMVEEQHALEHVLFDQKTKKCGKSAKF